MQKRSAVANRICQDVPCCSLAYIASAGLDVFHIVCHREVRVKPTLGPVVRPRCISELSKMRIENRVPNGS